MQERHQDRKTYFKEQSYTSGTYVIPFIEKHLNLTENTSILEVGCGEGGNLEPFLNRGCQIYGIDILKSKIDNALAFYDKHPNKEKLKLIAADIYAPPKELDKEFDLIIMRDVLEHIHDQVRFMHYIKKFLKADGLFYLGFPPWQNPFGGHQQMCYSPFLSKLPWFHLLPGKLYPGLMRIWKEPEGRIQDLLEIKDTRITIEKFNKILRKENYKLVHSTFWFFNPNYEIKFGLKPRITLKLFAKIPFIRNFYITTCYYLIKKSS